MVRPTCVAIAVSVSLWVVSPLQAAALFQGLGDLPGGDFNSQASGVSGDGSVIVGTGSSESDFEAFRWTKETGMVGLGALPGGISSFAAGVSADGAVVVGTSRSPSRGDAVRWTTGGGISSLGIAGGLGSHATGVSGTGAVVSGNFRSAAFASSSFAFRWTSGGGRSDLFGPTAGSLTSPTTVASAISQDGDVVVGFHRDALQGDLAVRWEGSSVMTITLGRANGVSADGSVAVGASLDEAFWWTTHNSGSIVPLGDLPGGDFRSEAKGVSGDGSIVVGVGATELGDEAFIWDQSRGMRSLKDVLVTDFGLGAPLSGWTLQSATAISADGLTVVGLGLNPNGDIEAWRAHLVPEPGAAAGLLAAGALLWRAAPRRRSH